MKVVIKKSTNPKKKYMAVFYENNKKVKTTHFGAAGMSDYTKHKDKSFFSNQKNECLIISSI